MVLADIPGWIYLIYLVGERKVRFLVGWVEPALTCWVSLRSTQPTRIKCLAELRFRRTKPNKIFPVGFRSGTI